MCQINIEFSFFQKFYRSHSCFQLVKRLNLNRQCPVQLVGNAFFPPNTKSIHGKYVRSTCNALLHQRNIFIHILSFFSLFSLSLTLLVVCSFWFFFSFRSFFSLNIFPSIRQTQSHILAGMLRCHFYLCHEVNAPRQHLIKCRSISAAFHLFIVKIVQCVHTA